jgi:kinesin family protein 2/24
LLELVFILYILDTNVVRKEYRNPDSEDEDNDDSYGGP